MDKYLAQVISVITSPVVVLSLTVYAFVAVGDPSVVLSGLLFLLVGGIPPLALSLYQYIKERDMEIDPDRSARQNIYLVAVFAFTLDSVIFGTEIAPNIFLANLAMVVAIFFAVGYLVNKYFDKFSVHVAMFAFSVMLLTGKLSPVFAVLFLLGPIVIWARMRLNKHTWLQILWGWAIGLAIGLLAWTL